MKMSSKAILVSKPNSFPFEDRVLVLDVPAKIGRAHRDDRSESGNGYFECKASKVESLRSHWVLFYLFYRVILNL